ncbi:DUF4402 domain-containing protein [Pontibacter silvestris]|uniref:DUF4402 domain-containing protein n=1 Tax=Pontibacter silvestris TaxID=2305183 RepID=A0ABW4X109_9BACT|nr:DUF4402 domain-containing protein [Pontibacter silvestris]MCC9135775.1 DUF4402 domain-containing protein [Pontibacter silvestris]
MKISPKITLFFFAILGFTINTNAQSNSASASARAFATIVTPISITNTQDLNFGTLIVQNNQGGNVTLNPEGTLQEAGTVKAFTKAGTEQASAAVFQVAGQAGYSYSVTLPTGELVLQNTNTSAGGNLKINNFKSNLQSGTLGSDGKAMVKIGATLIVENDQKPGKYANETGFQISVNYN